MASTVLGFKVFNIPDKGLTAPYVVARFCTGELWFYGQYETLDRAQEVAREIGNGIVAEVNRKVEEN